MGLATGIQGSPGRGCRAAAISLCGPGVPVGLLALHLRIQGSVSQGCSRPAGVLQRRRLLVLVLVLLGCHLCLHVLGLQAVGPRSRAGPVSAAAVCQLSLQGTKLKFSQSVQRQQQMFALQAGRSRVSQVKLCSSSVHTCSVLACRQLQPPAGS